MSADGWRDGLARHIGLDAEQKYEVYRSVAASAVLRDATYWAELLFSAGIATLGLTLGSPAVIIGAMLISPLMGPILSAGLALAAGDFVLALRAVTAVVLSSVAAIAFSTALVVLLPFREMTAEIAARTQPNTLDLVIALFSGAIGALAISKSLKGVATSLPGVAIAVALMPPLCVTGYGLGVLLMVDRLQGIAVLRGGALLFVTNLVAITFASMLVFLALHIDADAVRSRIRSARDTTAVMVLPRQIARIGSLPARLLLAAIMVAIVFVPTSHRRRCPRMRRRWWRGASASGSTCRRPACGSRGCPAGRRSGRCRPAARFRRRRGRLWSGSPTRPNAPRGCA